MKVKDHCDFDHPHPSHPCGAMLESSDTFLACPDCGADEKAPCPGTVRPVRACDWKRMLGIKGDSDAAS